MGPIKIVNFNVNWAVQAVSFPRFGIQLKDGQSAEEFMNEVEKKVNAMIGESTMNEYKAYKNLVKHKKRINRVFSEVCGEKSFRSRRPGLTMKVHAVAMASCSVAPLKASRRRGDTSETSSSTVCPEKTRSLESNKRKRKSSEVVSDAEMQAASSLAQLSRKKTKKVVKKITIVEVRHVPSVFDDDIIIEPSHKGFVPFLWPDLSFNVRRRCTPGFENEFVDVETFSDAVAEVQKEVTTSVAAAAVGVADPQPSSRQDEASPEFAKELEMTAHKGGDPAHEVPLVETRENLPEDQDPSPLMIAFNKSFGTSYRGELLIVGYEKTDVRDGMSKLLTLWNSSKIVDETGEGASKQTSPPLIGTPHESGKGPSSSSQRVTVETLSRKGSQFFVLLKCILICFCSF
jgi:uncharacterized protein YktA (UPF0223 family)